MCIYASVCVSVTASIVDVTRGSQSNQLSDAIAFTSCNKAGACLPDKIVMDTITSPSCYQLFNLEQDIPESNAVGSDKSTRLTDTQSCFQKSCLFSIVRTEEKERLTVTNH